MTKELQKQNNTEENAPAINMLIEMKNTIANLRSAVKFLENKVEHLEQIERESRSTIDDLSASFLEYEQLEIKHSALLEQNRAVQKENKDLKEKITSLEYDLEEAEDSSYEEHLSHLEENTELKEENIKLSETVARKIVKIQTLLKESVEQKYTIKMLRERSEKKIEKIDRLLKRDQIPVAPKHYMFETCLVGWEGVESKYWIYDMDDNPVDGPLKKEDALAKIKILDNQ